MTNQEIVDVFNEAFPQPTIWPGQRLTTRQCELLNAIAVELERRKIAIDMLRRSATP